MPLPLRLRVQRHFVALQQRGALLCLISRNHEADVRAVLRERRDEMALREEHLVAIRADWAPKSRHVLELASALCLGLASFVFVDDSPSECADVAAHCATVLTRALDVGARAWEAYHAVLPRAEG